MVNAEDMIEATTDNKISQLFIVSGLDPDTAKFAPQMQKVGGWLGWLTGVRGEGGGGLLLARTAKGSASCCALAGVRRGMVG